MSHWGYKEKSGAGSLKLAALKKFRLLEVQGAGSKREIKLTDLAKTILFYRDDPENPRIYEESIQEAALNPTIHQELWSKYDGDLPSDRTIKAYLLFQRNAGKFAEASVDGFIRQFRRTITFANLEKNDNMFSDEEDKITNQQIKSEMEPTSTHHPIKKVSQSHIMSYGDAEGETISIPIVFPLSGKSGFITIPKSLTTEEWQQMTGIIEAYKNILVSDNIDSGKNESEQ